jgi:very-short-patch-repair endonuclease
LDANQKIARNVAGYLRKNQRPSEMLLWEQLRRRRFLGLKFLRQHPIFYKYDNKVKYFIADFYCNKIKLIIEVDSGIHISQQEYDNKRSEILKGKNYKIIRVNNEDINNNINKVLIYLKKKIEQY